MLSVKSKLDKKPINVVKDLYKTFLKTRDYKIKKSLVETQQFDHFGKK